MGGRMVRTVCGVGIVVALCVWITSLGTPSTKSGPERGDGAHAEDDVVGHDARRSRRGRDATDVAHVADSAGVAGLVLDRVSGLPVRGAHVTRGGATTATDDRGAYRLPWRPGDGDLSVTADGFVSEGVRGEDLMTSEGRVATVWLRRIAATEIGTVADAAGRPVSGVTVRLGPRERTFVSDGDGRFGPFDVAECEQVTWSADGPDVPLTEGDWSWSDGRFGPVVVQLPDAAWVTVDVVDPAGAGVAGVPVCDAVAHDAGHHESTRRTDAAGRVEWPLAPGSRQRVTAEVGDFGGWTWVRAGGAARIVLVEGGGFRISHGPPPPPSPPDPQLATTRRAFTVVDDAGHALAGATVEVSTPDGAWRRATWADADGAGTIDVPGAPFRVSVVHPLRQRRALHFEDASQWPGRIVVEAPQRAPSSDTRSPDTTTFVEGRVVDAQGRGVPGADVATLDDGAATDVTGRFRLRARPTPASTGVIVSVEGHFPVERAVDATAGPVEIRLPARGRLAVELPQGVRDVEPEFVIWSPAHPGESLASDDAFDLLTSFSDRVELDLPEGSFDVRVRFRPGPWVQFDDVAIVGAAATWRRYDATPFAGLHLRVLDAAGRPVADAAVLGPGDEEYGQTDEAGDLHVEHQDDATVGPTRFVVFAVGFAIHVTPPLDTRRPVRAEVVLDRRAPRAGRVVDGDGRGVSGGVTWCLRSRPLESVRSDDDGRFRFEVAVPAGLQRFIVRRPERRTEVVEVDVDAASDSLPVTVR